MACRWLIHGLGSLASSVELFAGAEHLGLAVPNGQRASRRHMAENFSLYFSFFCSSLFCGGDAAEAIAEPSAFGVATP